MNKTIEDIIDTEYLEYAMYTLENRAIPSAIDGMKPVQRKLLYAMLNEHKGKVKLADMGNISKFGYHHGETSAISAAVGMTAPWSNNLPIFTGYGNFGSRLIQESAAPRYIYCSLSEAYKKYFVDTEVAPESDDAESPEPKHYLPLIPWILINGVSGIAVGFKTEILPRAPKDVLEAVKACLKDSEGYLKANKSIKPTFPNFRGETEFVTDNQWKTKGEISYIGKNFFQITELPVGYDRETYVGILNEMCDKELIREYEDSCSKDGFGFRIKVSIAQKEAIDKDPIKYFKLAKFHTEILTTIGHDGKLKIFNSVSELIAYFCEYRLKKMGDKIDYDIKNIKEKIVYLTDKCKFISDIVDDEIPLRETSKEKLLEYIQKWITDKEYGKSFIRIPLYECTVDVLDGLRNNILELEKELKILAEKTPESLYMDVLKTLR